MIHITEHAAQRWRERFAAQFPFGMMYEFEHARKYKPNELRRLGITVVTGRRYYITDHIIFVTGADSHTLITVLRRSGV